MKKVIIINGSGGSGKDTFVRCCGKFCYARNFSSVKDIKRAAEILGWNGEKDDKSRKFLSDLKDLSTKYNDHPWKSMKEVVKTFNESILGGVQFLHIREPEEVKRAAETFEAITVLIKRKSVDEIKTNHADANVDFYDYDFVIHNDGTIDDLEETARKFLIGIGIDIY